MSNQNENGLYNIYAVETKLPELQSSNMVSVTGKYSLKFKNAFL